MGSRARVAYIKIQSGPALAIKYSLGELPETRLGGGGRWVRLEGLPGVVARFWACCAQGCFTTIAAWLQPADFSPSLRALSKDFETQPPYRSVGISQAKATPAPALWSERAWSPCLKDPLQTTTNPGTLGSISSIQSGLTLGTEACPRAGEIAG